VRDDHRPVDAEGIQLRAGEIESGGAGVPIAASHPAGVWLARGLLAQEASDVFERAGPGEIGPARVERGQGQMVVGVDQPGKEGPAAELFHHGGRVGLEQRAGADGHDAPFLHDDDLRIRMPRIHRQDAPAEEGECPGVRHGAAIATSFVARQWTMAGYRASGWSWY